jgi:hypothetical protein
LTGRFTGAEVGALSTMKRVHEVNNKYERTWTWNATNKDRAKDMDRQCDPLVVQSTRSAGSKL